MEEQSLQPARGPEVAVPRQVKSQGPDIEWFIAAREYLSPERADQLRGWNEEVVSTGLENAMDTHAKELGLSETKAAVDAARREIDEASGYKSDEALESALKATPERRDEKLVTLVKNYLELGQKERVIKKALEEKRSRLNRGTAALQDRATLLAEHLSEDYSTEGVLGSLWYEYWLRERKIQMVNEGYLRDADLALQVAEQKVQDRLKMGLAELAARVAVAADKTASDDEDGQHCLAILRQPLDDLRWDDEMLRARREATIELIERGFVDKDTVEAATEVIKASKTMPKEKIDEIITGARKKTVGETSRGKK